MGFVIGAKSLFYLRGGMFGRLGCAHCNTAMIPERQKGHIYYRCHTAKCPTKTVREHVIDGEFQKMLEYTKISDSHFEQIEEGMNIWFEQRDKPRTIGCAFSH